MIALADALTIVIPTRNRTRYLERLLMYFSSTHNPYRIIIGDSSDPGPLQATRELIQRYSDTLKIEQRPFPPRPHLPPGQDGIECVATLLAQAQTPYALYMADDDFIVTEALEKGVRFLEDHPDYCAVNGDAILVGLKRQGEEMVVVGTSDYLQRGFEAERASDRITDHLVHFGATEFCIKRTAQIRESFQAVVSLGINNLFEEIFVNCLTMINGKVKKLDQLYMVRQGHAGQTSANSLSMFDWVVSPAFSSQFSKVVEYLAEKLAAKDQIPLDTARKVLRNGLWFYLADGLKRRWEQFCQPLEEKKPLKKMQLKARKIEAARLGWVQVRSLIPDRKGRMLLPALQRSTSPFHSAFKPIFNLISTTP